MRLFTYFIGVVFVLFALVQYNDADPILWIAIYLIPATIAFAFTYKKINRKLLAVFGILYLLGALYLFPTSINEWIATEERSKSLNMTLPGIEEARESVGLFICFFAISFFWLKSKHR